MEEGAHREIAIVDDKVVLTNDDFFKSSLGFLPCQRPWEMGNTLIQLLNSKNGCVYVSFVVLKPVLESSSLLLLA